ncbi:MAG: DMT family transporter [Brevinema sp.]
MLFHILVPLYLILCGFLMPLLRYTGALFSPLTSNGVRFISGGLLLLFLSHRRFRSSPESLTVFLSFLHKRYYVIFSMILLMSVNMVCMIQGLVLTSSFTAGIFNIFGIPATTLVATLFFQDERQRVFHFSFMIGMIICILGSLVFISQGVESIQFSQGFFYLGISVVMQIILNNMIKYLTQRVSILYLSTVTSLGAGIVLLIFAVISQDILELTKISVPNIILLIFAGFYGICVGMILGFSIIKQVGLSTFNVIQLLIPIAIAFIAFFLFHESISRSQIIGSGIIMIGAFFCIYGKKLFQKKLQGNL